jgi:hypothetical protein
MRHLHLHLAHGPGGAARRYNSAQGYIEAFLTVRKERRQRGSAYWTAYSHVGGRLRQACVGRSPAVTDARLRAIAALWDSARGRYRQSKERDINR